MGRRHTQNFGRKSVTCYLYKTKVKHFEKLNVMNEQYAKDPRPFDENCGCPACRNYSRSYVRHLIKAKESLGMRLAVAHNLYFYNNLTRKIREALEGGYFESFYQKYRNILGERSQD